MAIIVNTTPPIPPYFKVDGRVGFDKSVRGWVDSMPLNSAGLGSGVNPLAPVERRYDPSRPHQDNNGTPGQGTMRAHHVADHEIQNMVCDFMNGLIDTKTLFDRVGTLYLTGWIDVIVTPRIFKIWVQWAEACVRSCHLMLSRANTGTLGWTRTKQAEIATKLAKTLSSSIANLRIGHGVTDSTLEHAIAPRMQRGQIDILGWFLQICTGHDFKTTPTLSVETSLASVAWGGHYIAHPPVVKPGYQLVNNVFVGQIGAGNILISEQDPVLPNAVAVVPTPAYYPGTQGDRRYMLRATRTTMHACTAIALIYFFIHLGYFLISSLGDEFASAEL